MASHVNKSNKWKLALALCSVALSVAILVGAFTFVDFDSNADDYIVTSAAIKDGATVYADYTEETIKEILVVDGKLGNDGEVVHDLSADLYSVTINSDGILKAGEENTITVGDIAVDMTGITVVPAELIEATLIAKGYDVLDNGFYRNADGFYAFTQGMDEDTVKSRLQLRLQYSKSVVTMEMDEMTSVTIGYTGTTETTNDMSLNVPIRVDFTVDGEAKYVDTSFSFRRLELGALKISDDWSAPVNLTASTAVNANNLQLAGKVFALWNNGLERDGADRFIDMQDLGFTGLSLAPQGSDILGEKSPYERTLEIPYTGSLGSDVTPLKLTVKVQYVAPTMILPYIMGDIAQQVARSPMNYSGLYLQFMYNGNFASVYLEDLVKDGSPCEGITLESKYYDTSGGTDKEESKLTRTVDKITVVCSFQYDDGHGNKITFTSEVRSFEDVVVNQSPISQPILGCYNAGTNAYELPFQKDDCSTTLTGVDTGDSEDNMSVVISETPNGTQSANATYTDGTISFSRGGKFYVSVSLGESSDFRFDDSSRPTYSKSSDKVVYEVTVTKVSVDLQLTYNNGNKEIEYGDAEQFTINGQTVSAGMDFTLTDNSGDRVTNGALPSAGDPLPLLPAEDDQVPSYRLYYHGTYAADVIDDSGNNLSGQSYSGYAFPKYRGTYTVYAQTAETAWYQAGKSAETTFTIVTHKIELGLVALASPTFDKDTVYTEADVRNQIDTTSITFASGDSVSDVLQISFNDSITSCWHAQKYDIDITIINKNYEWKNKSATNPDTQQEKFEIKPRTIAITATRPDFTYGDTISTASVTASEAGYISTFSTPAYKYNGSAISSAPTSTSSAGQYTAEYTAATYATHGTNGQIWASDVTLDTTNATATFSILRRAVSALTFDSSVGTRTYNGSDQEFTVNGWSSNALDMGILIADGIANVLELKAVGTLLSDGTTAITTNLSYDYANGAIKVREAGTYTFSVTIKDTTNYMWTGEDNKSTTSVPITYSATVDQATYTVMWQKDSSESVTVWTNSIVYEYDNVAHYPTLSVNEADSTNNLTLQYAFYSDSACNIPASQSAIVAADTYYVKVTGITGSNIGSASYTYAVNYKNPAVLVQSFTIANKGLAKPTLDTSMTAVLNASDVLVEYNGATVVFSNYILGYDNYKLGAIEMLSFTYSVSNVESTPKNVLDNGNGAYTVSVTPAGNFEWSDGTDKTEAVKFYLYITQKEVGLTWSSNVEYDSNYHKPTATATGLFGSDSVTVTVAYVDGSENKVNAGKYNVKAAGLTGADAGNYKLPAQEADVTHEFAIYKQAIAQPAKPTLTTTYNGVQTTTYSNAMFANGAVSAEVTGKYPAEFGITANDGKFSESVLAQCSFDVTTGQFTFVNAGVYTVTFTINNANYCWQGQGKEYDFDNATYSYAWDDFATVNRKTIVSPAFGANRAMEWTGDIADLGEFIQNELTKNGYTFDYTTTFFNSVSGDFSTTQSTIDRDSESKAIRGQYYVLLTIDGEDKYNYKWLDVAHDNSDGTGYAGSAFISGGKVFEITDNADGAQIKLYYAITASQVNIELTINNYMFGANGAYIGNAENDARIDYLSEEVIKITNPLESEATYTGEDGKGGSIVYKFFTDKDGANELTTLVNGLPWDVGTYYVQIVIVFDKIENPENHQLEEVYSKWDSGLQEIKVTKRPLEVNWSFGSPYADNAATIEYDGTRHLPTATVTNMPGQNDQATDLPTLTYNFDSTNAPLNAQTAAYSIKVAGGYGNNFSLEGTAAFTLTITKRAVSIAANANQSHVYGNTFDVRALWSTVNGTSFCSDADSANIQAVLLRDGEGSILTDANTAAGTSYMLCPVWGSNVAITWTSKDDGTYTISTTNYVISVTAAQYTIEKRQVTVTFNADGATSVYGQTAVLANAVDTLTSANGTGNVLVGNDNNADIFTLAAYLDDTKVTELDTTKWAAATYVVKGAAVEGNYDVTFANDGAYVITNAEITNANAEGYNGTYDGNSHLMFGAPTADSVNAQPLTWYYQAIDATDKEAWTEYTAQSLITNVLESGQYYVKVEAPNHDPAVLMDGASQKVVHVTVSKKNVTVQINIAIKYGEQSPADVNYLMNVSDLNKTNYAFVGLCESVNDVANLKVNGKLYSTNYNQGDLALGSYGLVLQAGALTADNYTFVDAGTGVLTVNKLAIEVTINDVTTTYFTTLTNAIFKGCTAIKLPASTYDSEQEVELASELKETILSDGANHEYFQGVNIIELSTTAYVNGVAQNAGGNYSISGVLTSAADANFTAEFKGSAKHFIDKASLTPAEVQDYTGTYDKQPHGLNGNGWAATVDGSAVTVNFYVSNGIIDASSIGWETSDLLSANPMFVNASTYYVYYCVTASNHDALYGMNTVVINKRAISIDAQNVTLTYGDDAPAFYNYTANAVTGNFDSGLVGGDTLESIFADYLVDGKLPAYFTSTYAAGRTYGYGGDHAITCNVDASDYHDLQNYYIDNVIGATVHVNKLVVTISIADAENFYNLSVLDNMTGTYSKEKLATLTWNYADNSNRFLDSDYENGSVLVFELYTEAWTSHNGKLTNKVVVGGGYPIYARWLTYVDGARSFKDNYTIEFVDCGYTGELPSDAITGSAAGIYTIKPAQVFVEWSGPFDNEEGTIAATNKTTYSGKPKYYKATVKIDDDADDVKFNLTYIKGNTQLDSAPINVGAYRVTATTDDTNYVAGYSIHNFEIERATLVVGWELNDSVAGTIQYGEKITDFDEATHSYPASANGRFSGLKFTFSSQHYDISAIASDKLTETLGIASYGYTTAYNPAQTQIGNISIITNIVLSADSNFTILTQSSQTLVVETRKISVWAKGLNDSNAKATSTYTGVDPLSSGAWKSDINTWLQATDDDAFVNGNKLQDLDVVLSLATNKYDVGTYGIESKQGSGKNANYTVTFVDGEGDEIGSNNRPTYKITKATLKVRTLPTSVVYGNALPEALLNGVANDEVTPSFLNTYVAFNGWQNGEGYLGINNNDAAMSSNKFVFTVAYAPYETNVGNTLVISLDASVLEFTNYVISYETANNGKLNVTKRPISAATSDREYEEAKDGNNLPLYNNGVYGAALEAQIDFANHNDGVNYSSQYLPVFTRTYNTKVGTGQTEGKAPTKVGNYTVTVTLSSNSNYTFVKDGAQVNNVTLDYSVYKKTIAPSWKESAIKNDASDSEAESGLENSLIGFVQSIMDITRFEKTNGLNVLIPQIPAGMGADTYQVGTDANGQEVGLTITVSGRGEYRITLTLTEAAQKNYKFDAAEEDSITIIFTVSSEVVIINNLHLDDWIYLDPANEATFDIVGGNKGDVVFTYAKVNGEVPSNPDNAWYQKLLYSATPYEVGVYALRAVHPSTVNADGETVGGAVVYCLFRITPRMVTAPTITTSDLVYTGDRLQAVIAFNPVELRIANYSGLAYEIVEGNTVLYATNANENGYIITFDLVDSKNYQWGEVTSLKWTISPATGSTITWNAHADINYGETFAPSATATYGGNVTYYYMAKLSATDTTKPDRNDANWSATFNKNVGYYWVKAERAATSNYDGAYAIESFEIKKATLTVTPVGSMVYGSTFNPTSSLFRYEITDGLVNFDSKEVIKTVDGVKISYAVLNDSDKLNAKTYGFVLNSQDGYVIGLTADNYYIVSGTGTFTVTQRPVTITLGNASSQYGTAINLGNVAINYSDSLAEKEVELNLYATANTTSDCGIYRISANHSNGNYSITLVDGVYTVVQRQVTVRIDSVDEVEYGAKVSNPIEYSVLDANGEDITTFVTTHNFTLKISYSGKTNDGTAYPESETMPILAGTYTATVRGSGNSNFVVVGEPFTSFTVSKKQVDSSLIKIASQVYTGLALTPVINADEFEALYGNDIYEVGSLEGFVNVGSHGVTLTLNDIYNYKWKSVEISSCDIEFVITQAVNEATVGLTINGWTYGEYSADNNMPAITVKFGQADVQFVYSAARDGEYKAGAPEAGDVGEYYVKAIVSATSNYGAFESAPVKFAITKKALAKPTLTVVSDGEGKNDVYTGEDLLSTIVGFNMALMNLDYEGKFNVNAGQVVVIAVNAGTYTVKLSIADTRNYAWQGTEGNDVELTWTIAPKAIAKPTANTSTFMVNGQVLTYIPQGFDETVMTIEGNQTAYGGEFPVTVGLLDKANYVWEDGTTDDFELVWNVVGANTVFIIIACTIGGACVVTVLAAGLQLIMHRRRKRIIDRDIDARSKAEEAQTNKGGNE